MMVIATQMITFCMLHSFTFSFLFEGMMYSSSHSWGGDDSLLLCRRVCEEEEGTNDGCVMDETLALGLAC